MRGYFAFPPSLVGASIPVQPLNTEVKPSGECTTWSNRCCHDTAHFNDDGNARQATDGERHKRREQERVLGERSEIEWVRAGGMLRDAFGRRDKARTERIRQELTVQNVERARMARWEAYEAQWRTITVPDSTPVTFVEFPWPLGERVVSRDVSVFARRAVSEFLFESLTVRTNTITKRERIRSSLLRWHPDKISPVLNRVVSDDLELVREGVYVVFGILKELQDAERTGALN